MYEGLARVLSEHVSRQIGLLLGHVIAEWTLEARRLAALVAEVGAHVMTVLVAVAAARTEVEFGRRRGERRRGGVAAVAMLLLDVTGEVATAQAAVAAVVAAHLDVLAATLARRTREF